MIVPVDISEEEVDGDYGSIPGLRLSCERCGYSVEVFGTQDTSARRGALMLREGCPNGENNYYDVSGWN
jgi:hypothetical protein